MTRAEQLVFCKKCKNRHLDFDKGLLCKLTMKEADFEEECSDYELDPTSTYIPKLKHSIRPNSERAKAAEYLIWALLIFGLISLGSSYLQYDLLVRLQEGFPVSDHQLEMNDLREGGIGIMTLALYITSVVTFIRWFRRAYFNLHSRTVTPLYDEGWAAGAWFVPILNLFRPYKIMQEIDEETSLLISKRTQEPVKKDNVLIGSWWALWIIAGIVGRYIFRIGLRAETLEDLMQSTKADMVGILIDTPLAILAILVIRAVSKKELQLEALEKKEALNS